MAEIDFDVLLPQEGFKINVDDVDGIDLYSEMDDPEALGDADDEQAPDFTAHLFRSNDFNISYLESEPGGVLDWHTHDPDMYQINFTTQGRVEISYRTGDDEVHTVEAGPEELVYLPPGAQNKVKCVGDERVRLYVVYRQMVVPQIEQMVGEADQHPETNPALEIDTIRGILHAIQDDAVERY